MCFIRRPYTETTNHNYKLIKCTRAFLIACVFSIATDSIIWQLRMTAEMLEVCVCEFVYVRHTVHVKCVHCSTVRTVWKCWCGFIVYRFWFFFCLLWYNITWDETNLRSLFSRQREHVKRTKHFQQIMLINQFYFVFLVSFFCS